MAAQIVRQRNVFAGRVLDINIKMAIYPTNVLILHYIVYVRGSFLVTVEALGGLLKGLLFFRIQNT